MPPKTIATPEQVAEDRANNPREDVRQVTPEYRKNKNPGVNKDITLTTENPEIDTAWVKE